MIRLLIPFLGGVIFALIKPDWKPEEIWLIGISGLLSGLLLLFTLIGKLSFSLRWIPGLTINLLILCLGMFTVQSHLERSVGSGQWAVGKKKLQTANCQLFPAEILEPPRHTSKSVRLIVRQYELDSLTKSLIRRGKALLFLAKETNSLALQYGDWILVSNSLKPVKSESNPYGFDPAGYYGRKGVFNQGWVASENWRSTGILKCSSINRLAFSLRNRLLKILKDNSLKGEEFAVASAILLGYTGEIGKDLRKGFAASGAMHILAVSGMHVGVIFLFLETILAFLNRRTHGPKIKALLMILMIWSYAMITGLSPPVFRAALMLSLVILGRAARRKPDSLNVVGGSMFIILVLDPSLILHIGFQFSYLAVVGILFLYKPIVHLIPANGWVLTRLRGLVAVSVAAQLATFPLALFVFHQFPNYFILTNVVVLPLASLVIYSGIGVLVLSPFPPISVLLAKGLSFIVGFLNSTIRFIEELPGSTSTGIYPSLPDTFLLYLVMLSVGCYLFSRKTSWLYTFLVLLIIGSVLGVYRDYLRANRRMITVFQVKGASQYAFVTGRNMVCMKDFRAACQETYSREVIATLRAAEGITRSQTTYLIDPGSQTQAKGDLLEFGFLSRKGDFLQFSDCRIAIVSTTLPSTLSDTMHVDLVILRKNPAVNMETIVRTFNPQQIVIDPTNSWYRARKWKAQAEELGIPCYNVLEEGAFVLDNWMTG
ncbi:MAG: ComEC family competence protein [Bacteroidales bacterium]|nr:ComEC family competence protein [Bacteroidales bacterium]